MNPSVQTVLEAARTMIEEVGWVTHKMRAIGWDRDASGREVDMVYGYCATGAVAAALGGGVHRTLSETLLVVPEAHAALCELALAVDSLTGRSPECRGISTLAYVQDFNDTSPDKQRVLAMFDRAIENLEAS